MRYMGSKNKIAKYILPIILQGREKGQWYVEPFVGGANLIDKVNGNRLGSDTQYYIITLLQAAQKGWTPPTEISEEFYQQVRKNKDDYPPELVGFIGQCCTFGGRWWEGYAKDNNRNYARVASRSLLKQIISLKGVIFKNKSYLDLKIPLHSIIYCDPPYQNTKQYKDQINYNIFWEWCRKKSKQGNSVFISEYNAPQDFECLIAIPHYTEMNKNKKGDLRTEKLFRFQKNKP